MRRLDPNTIKYTNFTCRILGRRNRHAGMMLAPVMEALEPEVPGVKFCKVNVDDERDLAMEFQIESIPTLLCVKGGKTVKRLVGFREKDALKKELEAL